MRFLAPSIESLDTTSPPAPDAAPPVRRSRRRRAGRVVAIVAGGALLFGAGIGVDRVALIGPQSPIVSTGSAEFDLIRQAWDLLEQDYVGARSLDERELAYGAIRGLTEAVGDTGHTDFMDPDERKSRGDALSGTYVGIGIALGESTGGPVITEVFDGGPAAKGGLHAGDRIVAVDGTSVTGDDAVQAIRLIRGPEGSSTVLTIDRDGADRFDATLDRAAVEIPAISWAMVPGTTIADIQLRRFQTGAADELTTALAAARDAGATGIIFDLRGNSGGYTNEALGVASQFLADGIVYKTEDASGAVTDFTVDANRTTTELPVVVLIDNDSASSSEIVAGALKDRGRATLVGQTTFGTGTVLAEFALSDGSALRIGTVNWLTPNGTLIWHQGITPDDAVALPDGAHPVRPGELKDLTAKQVRASTDAQLLRALEILTSSAA